MSNSNDQTPDPRPTGPTGPVPHDEWGVSGSWAPLPKPVPSEPPVVTSVRRVAPVSEPHTQSRVEKPVEPIDDVDDFDDDLVDRDVDDFDSDTNEFAAQTPGVPVGKRSGRERRGGSAPAAVQQSYEDFPPPRRGRAFLGFLLTLALIAGGILYGVKWYQKQVDPPGLPGAAVQIVIPPNTSTSGISTLLHNQKVIGNAKVFRYWAQIQGKGGFEAGKYTFKQNSSFASTLDVLLNGPTVPDQQKVTIPEGFRIEQIAERVSTKIPGKTADKFLAAVKDSKVRSSYQPADVTSLEGFLFPDTYTVSLEEDEAAIASRMVENFDAVADGVGLSASKEKVEIDPYQALIVASLVEREAKLDSDRPKIARVIYNRLKADMYLQIDATLIYALNNNTTRLLLEDLKMKSPYNSYNNKGLPPGPIANPGRASLEAALNPEPGDWLYYVVTGPDGSHSFATSYKAHKRNIALAKERGVR
jgi:UPF0755 protein